MKSNSNFLNPVVSLGNSLRYAQDSLLGKLKPTSNDTISRRGQPIDDQPNEKFQIVKDPEVSDLR